MDINENVFRPWKIYKLYHRNLKKLEVYKKKSYWQVSQGFIQVCICIYDRAFYDTRLLSPTTFLLYAEMHEHKSECIGIIS